MEGSCIYGGDKGKVSEYVYKIHGYVLYLTISRVTFYDSAHCPES